MSSGRESEEDDDIEEPNTTKEDQRVDILDHMIKQTYHEMRDRLDKRRVLRCIEFPI